MTLLAESNTIGKIASRCFPDSSFSFFHTSVQYGVEYKLGVGQAVTTGILIEDLMLVEDTRIL